MDDKHLAEILNDVLSALPWPYHLQDAPGTEDIYLTAYMMPSVPLTYASNVPTRAEEVAQVSIYSRYPVIEEISITVAALRRAGLRISQAGSQGYDSQTQLYNSPIIVRRVIKDNL